MRRSPLARRYGHASKAERESAERAQLRAFLVRHGQILDGTASPLSKFEKWSFEKLAWKYKYHPDFQDDMMVRHAGRPGRKPESGDMPVMSNKVRIPGRAD